MEESGRGLIKSTLPAFCWRDGGKSQESLSCYLTSGLHSKQGAPEYELGALTTRPQR
jgi:hypothetical protein